MTLPIVPGPFSFLAELGRAGGAAFEQAEKDRQLKLKEAQDKLNQMIQLRGAGLIKPEAFATPEMQDLYKQIGIMPVSGQMTPAEQVNDLKSQYLSAVNGPNQQINIPIASLGIGGVDQTMQLPQTARFSDEQRRVIGVPTQDQIAVEQAKGAEARAQVPEIGTTTTASQYNTQDEQFNSEADRVVQDLYSATGKIPSPEEAFRAAQGDERYRKFGPQKITQPYFGQAAERLRRRLADEETARRLANARLQGASGTGLDDLAKLYQRNIDQLNKQAEYLAKAKGVTSTMQAAYSVVKSSPKGKKVSPYMQEQAAQYEAYLKELADIQSQMRAYSEKLNAVLGPSIGVEPPPTRFSPEQQRRDWDEAADALKAQGKKPDEVLGPRP